MPLDSSEIWFLKKHESGEVFGPVSLRKIREWANAAQVNPQDLLSTDQVVWTRPPMVPELEMDWLVELSDELLYGPTTGGTLMEFVVSGEISESTMVINTVTGKKCSLSEAPFFDRERLAAGAAEGAVLSQPVKGGIRANLQRRVRELEQLLLARQRQLVAANEKIERLEARVADLETRLKEATGFRTH